MENIQDDPSIERRHEKTGFFAYAKTKAQISCAVDQRLCFRYIDSLIPLLSKSKVSSLLRSLENVQPGLCPTWLETPITGFLMSRLIYEQAPTLMRLLCREMKK